MRTLLFVCVCVCVYVFLLCMRGVEKSPLALLLQMSALLPLLRSFSSVAIMHPIFLFYVLMSSKRDPINAQLCLLGFGCSCRFLATTICKNLPPHWLQILWAMMNLMLSWRRRQTGHIFLVYRVCEALEYDYYLSCSWFQTGRLQNWRQRLRLHNLTVFGYVSISTLTPTDPLVLFEVNFCHTINLSKVHKSLSITCSDRLC